MANLYDVCNLVFENDDYKLEHNYNAEFRDFDDHIEIVTDLVFNGIERGWVGNITFNFNGYNIKEYSGGTNRDAHMQFTLKDVLCVRRVFDKDIKDIARWTYMFLKY